MEANQLSREAYDRLQAELEDLTTRGRIEVAEKIERARELGDLSENGDYHAAKDEQGHMEGRIRQLEHDPRERRDHRGAGADGVVGPGTIVTIVYEGDSDDDAERYLVGHIEEKTDDLDVVSPTAPLGARADRRTAPATRSSTRRPPAPAAGPGPRGGGGLTDAITGGIDAELAPLDDLTDRARRAGAAAGRDVELSAGTIRLRELPGPPGAPGGRPAARLDGDGRPQLLHVLRGRSASTSASSRSTTVATATGSAAGGAFRLEDCADDVAALLDVVGVDRLIAVGYSMGGAVAQLLWRRHPERVRGLVLCATAAQFNGPLQRAPLVPRAARPRRAGPADARRRCAMWLTEQLYLAAPHRRLGAVGDRGGVQPRLADGPRGRRRDRHVPSAPWLGEVDVPTAVVVTMQRRGRADPPPDPAVRVDPGRRVRSGSTPSTTPSWPVPTAPCPCSSSLPLGLERQSHVPLAPTCVA